MSRTRRQRAAPRKALRTALGSALSSHTHDPHPTIYTTLSDLEPYRTFQMSLVTYVSYYRLNQDLAHDKAFSRVSESHETSRTILDEAVKLGKARRIALGGEERTKAFHGKAALPQRKSGSSMPPVVR